MSRRRYCGANREKSSFGGTKNSIPGPIAGLPIGGENNCIGDAQPLSNANTEGGENNIFNIDSQPLPIADNEGGEYNFTMDAQPLPNAGGEYNFSRDTQLVPNADNKGGENNFTTDTLQLPNVDNKGGANNSTRETQPLPNVDNGAMLLSLGKCVSNQQKRHQTKMPPALNEPKKPRKYNESMAVAMKHMANAVTSLTKKTKKEDNFSVGNVISVLQAIPDLDDDLILDAIDFLEDERRGRMFLALGANLRKKWLLRKLRS